jgi:hypothetical protein
MDDPTWPSARHLHTYQIRTCGHGAGGQPAGWGLTLFRDHGGTRNGGSTWLYVHDGDTWRDWVFEKKSE